MQACAPVASEYLAAGQVVHVMAAATALYLPGTHFAQLVAPVAADVEPIVQSKHVGW